MVKLIGALLILSSVLALIAGAFVDLRYGSNTQITGKVVSNILAQTDVDLNFFDYVEAIAISYSIVSLIMGLVFLFRV